MKLYEHIKDFTIKYCDSDFKDELKTSVALALMEEVACSSADELGFGYAFVKPRGYAFMVTNVCMEFLGTVSLGDTVQVKTWPLPPTRVTFGREYRFELNGETVLKASSRWCLVDTKEGKILESNMRERGASLRNDGCKFRIRPQYARQQYPLCGLLLKLFFFGRAIVVAVKTPFDYLRKTV